MNSISQRINNLFSKLKRVKRTRLIAPAALALCLIVAIVLSVSVIIDNAKRESNSRVTEAADFQEGKRYNFLETIDYNNLQTIDLVVNGSLQKYDSCYKYKEAFYVPLEKILFDIGVNYTFYEADGEIDFLISGSQVKLVLGKNKLIFACGEFPLAFPAIIHSGKIYVTTDMFDFIKTNFYSHSFGETDTSKTFYFSFFPNEKYSGMSDKKFVYETPNGVKYTTLFDYISSINTTAAQVITVQNEQPAKYTNCIMSPSGKFALASDAVQTRILSLTDPEQGKFVAEEVGYNWSTTGDYAYKFKFEDLSLNIYDPVKNLSYKYKNIFKSVFPSSAISEADFNAAAQSYQLQKYYKSSSNETIILKSSKESRDICAIYRKSIVSGRSAMTEFFNGKVECSPDLSKIAFNVGDVYYISNADGTKKIKINASKELSWVSNRKLKYTDSGNNIFIYDVPTNKKTAVTDVWNYVSSSAAGNCIYYTNRDVWIENAQKTQIAGTLPWDCEYTYLPDGAQYMINVSQTEDGSVYAEKNGELQYITSKDKLIYNKSGKTPQEKYKDTFVYFKSQSSVGILINDNGRMGIVIVDFSGANKNQNTYYFDSAKITDNPIISFISDNEGEIVLFYNNTVIMLKVETQVFMQKIVVNSAKALYIGS